MTNSMRIAALLTGMALLWGCAGKPVPLKVSGSGGTSKEVVFPKGTLTGKVSREQAEALARLTADTHNQAMANMGEINSTVARTDGVAAKIEGTTQRMESDLKRMQDTDRKLQGSLDSVESSTRKLEADVRDTQEKVLAKVETTSGRLEQRLSEIGSKGEENDRHLLAEMEKQARNQGSGEITIFFGAGQAAIPTGSLEHNRLVNFLDYLARDAAGRKVLFVAVGSASAFGSAKVNEDLARKRSETPRPVIARYLVNTPYEFYKTYGTGDTLSPKGVSMEEHQRYQSVRLIAVFDTSQIPQ